MSVESETLLLLLTALAFVQARPNEDAVVTNAKLHELHEAVLAQSSNADDCETLDNGCPVDYTIHKIIPHEQNCQLFYVCDKGEKVLLPCPEPLYFDAVTQRCVWSWQTDCVNDNSNTDQTTTAFDFEATTAADDIEATTAADDIEATTINGNLDIGDVLENGCPVDIHIHHLLPHEECEKFYQCNFGEKVERDCAPGTVFHFEIQVCDWPRNVPRCAGSAGATARPSTTPDSEEAPATNDPGDWEALPNGCPVNSSILHLLPHESECDKYYVCDNGGLVEMGCPTATHFSPSLQKCTWPHEAGCEHWTGGGCSKPDSSCGGSTGTPNNSTTPDSNVSTTPSEVPTTTTTTTELPCDTEVPIIDSSTTPDGPTDGNEEIKDPTLPGNETTTESNISTTPPTTVPDNSTTTAAPIGSSTPDFEITTELLTVLPENSTTTAAPIGSSTPDFEITTELLTVLPENSTTTAAPISSSTPDFEITTELLTVLPENSTTTAAPIDDTTDEIATVSSTDTPEISTTTTEEPLCNTETPTPSGTEDPIVLPEEGTTATPGCPICPTVPVSPAERCKQGCNVAPWAHEECDKYYSCIGDEFRLNICAEGLHFNPNTFTCDFICNAGCVRNVPQITRHPDGVLMFVPNSVNSKMNMMELIEHELNGDL